MHLVAPLLLNTINDEDDDCGVVVRRRKGRGRTCVCVYKGMCACCDDCT